MKTLYSNIVWTAIIFFAFHNQANGAEYVDLIMTRDGVITLYSSDSIDTYDYTITMDGYKTNYMLTSDEINFSGYKIIPNRCFEDCFSIDTIIIPDGIEEIHNEAFLNCVSLKYVYIPSTVKKIGLRVFANCSNLSTICVDANNVIYDSRDNCNAIIETSTNTLVHGCKTTIVPNGIKTIGNSAFYGINTLEKIILPESVESIDFYAFMNCQKLKQIVFANNIEYIGHYAFDGCKSLKRISLPKSVTYTGYSPFANCISLKRIKISAWEYVNESSFAGCTSLKKIVLPSTVQKIGNFAFMDCPNLRTVTIKNPKVVVDECALPDKNVKVKIRNCMLKILKQEL